MKDNKKILSEISRIHDMMGLKNDLNNNLLNESILDDLFKAGAKGADETLTIGGKVLSDDVVKAIDNIKAAYDTGTKTLSKSLDEVLVVVRKSHPELVDELIDNIINHPVIVDSFIRNVDDAAKAVRSLVEQGKTVDEAIKAVQDVYGPKFKNSDLLPSEVFDRFMKEVGDDVEDIKPKQETPITTDDGETPTPNNSETSIPSIEKSLSEIVDTIDDAEIAAINAKYTSWWGKTIERLKAATIPIFRSSITLQETILRDMAVWQKASPNAKPVIRKRIIANLEALEAKNKELLEATENWIDAEIRPMASQSVEVRNFYNKVKAKDGWKKITILQNVFNGAGLGLKDVMTNNKVLRQAWLKAIVKPFTIPTNILIRIVNKIWDKELNLIGKMTPEQTTAFKNWFWTTNPAGWKAVKEAFGNQGFFGGLSYVGAQLVYRYFLVSTMIGVGRTLGALAAEGVDFTLEAFDIDSNIADSSIINYLFGTSNLQELNKSLKENPEQSDWAYAGAIIDMISMQSEPFRNWVGMWPAATVGRATWDLVKSIQNGTLTQSIEDLEREGQELQQQLDSTAQSRGVTLPPILGGTDGQDGSSGTDGTSNNNSTPGSLEHAKSNLGSDATQDGEYYISSGLKFKWNPTTNTYDWIE